MALKNDRYTYRVTWSEDDNEYVGLCAEFPSLSWLAPTPEAALKGIRKLVADHQTGVLLRSTPAGDFRVPVKITEKGVEHTAGE